MVFVYGCFSGTMFFRSNLFWEIAKQSFTFASLFHEFSLFFIIDFYIVFFMNFEAKIVAKMAPFGVTNNRFPRYVFIVVRREVLGSPQSSRKRAQRCPAEPRDVPKTTLRHPRRGPNLSKRKLRHPKVDPRSSFFIIWPNVSTFGFKKVAQVRKIAKHSLIFATITHEIS